MAKEKKIQYSACPHNCWPINCGIEVESCNGEVTDLRGNPYHDFNRGMLCVKGQASRELINNPERLRYPLRRLGERGSDQWEKISWQEALDTIAFRMKANIDGGHPEANAIYHSHGNIVQRINWMVLTPRFANLLGMTFWDGNFPCWYDVGVAQEITGFYGLHDPVEMGEHAATLVNWAQDACASEANMAIYMSQLRDRGGTMITIDPRVTQTAAISDIHIRPRFGSDVWLANAVANILIREGAVDEEFITDHSFGYEKYREHVLKFEPAKAAAECELDLKEIETLAAYYAEDKPLCTNLTRGALGKHWNGVQMVRSILCLVALSGNVARKGGGAVWGEAVDWNLELRAADQRPRDIDYPPNNFNAISDAFDAGIIDTFLVVGGNPMSQWPNINRLREQLKKLGLIVVFDIFMNRTAREVADIILPGTIWLEELGLRTSNSRIYIMDKVLEPFAECREASAWMKDLAAQVGVKDYWIWQSKEECLDHCLQSPACHNATVEKLRQRPDGIKADILELPYSDHNFSSPSGKFEFYSQKGEELGLDPLPSHTEPVEGVKSTPDLAEKYPLTLISARRNTHFHSFHDNHQAVPVLKTLEPEPLLWIHPKDARGRGLWEGDYAEMFNDRGCARVRLEVTTEVSPGHVSLNDAWPELNMVTSSKCPCSPEVTKALNMGGQPAYQNALVDVRKEE